MQTLSALFSLFWNFIFAAIFVGILWRHMKRRAILKRQNLIPYAPGEVRLVDVSGTFINNVNKASTHLSRQLTRMQPNPFAAKKIIVINFDGDVMATGLHELERKVNLITTMPHKPDEVVVKLTSYGGAAARYGLGASILQRIKDAGIFLTVCVDEAAASGGYQMASRADKIVASPWATVGSIGVRMDIPNYSGALDLIGVKYIEASAGEAKRIASIYSEPEEGEKERLQAQLDAIHEQFKKMVSQTRNIPEDKQEVAFSGASWTAQEAVDRELALVDELKTSGGYLAEKLQEGAVYLAEITPKVNLFGQPVGEVPKTVEKIYNFVEKKFAAKLAREKTNNIQLRG